MNPPDPAQRRTQPRRRRRDTRDAAVVEKTGNVEQHDNKIAIAHTGAGNIIVSIGNEAITVDLAELLVVGGTAPPAASIPHTLPRDITEFTGRGDELEALVEAIRQAVGTGRPVVIHAIEGMAGIGKTALAVHAAHRLIPHFPDGQLFMRLHAHMTGTRPIEPSQALTALLREIGVDARKIPDSMEEKEHLWRDQLTNKRILILLDDAANHEQVLPLLPGGGSSAVMVTSRRRLEEFGGDARVELDVLPADKASQLYIRLSGREDSHSEAVSELVRLAGHLPLAIRMLAGRLRSRPQWKVADLVLELASARDRSAAIGGLDQPVSAAFDLSYNPLPVDRKQFFRRLGLHPGSDIDTYAAAAVGGIDLDQARQQLDALYADHLIDEPTKGRYRFHDLLRDYARALATTDPVEDQDAAIDRLFSYYLRTAEAAGHYLNRYPPVELRASAGQLVDVPSISTNPQAAAWMETERANLQAVADHANHGRPSYAIAIPAAVADFLHTTGHWEQASALHNTAMAAARREGDRLGEASALFGLGTMETLRSEYPAATTSLTTALELYQAVGNEIGQANALYGLSILQDRNGDYDASTASLTQALELYHGRSNKLGEANVFNSLGNIKYMKSEYPAATGSLTRALELYRVLGRQQGQAHALNNLGNVQYLTSDYPAATASYSTSLDLYRALGDRHGEEDVLTNLGNVQCLTGEYVAATTSLTLALDLCRTLGERWGEGVALTSLGVVQYHTGEYTAAVTGLTQALEIFRDLGERYGEGHAIAGLGVVQYMMGEYTVATASQTQALEMFQTLGNRLGQAECLNNMAEILLASLQGDQAQTYGEQALTIAREVASPLEEARALESIAECQIRKEQRGEATLLFQHALEIYRQLGSPYAKRVEAGMSKYGIR